jgi:hypothetical protein
MRLRSLAAALLVALPASTLAAACDRSGDPGRAALEQDALERDLDLALQADTAVRHELADVPETEPPVAHTPPAPEPEPQAAPEPRREPPAPAPAPRTPPRPSPRAETPAPEPVRDPEPATPRFVTRTAPAGTEFAVRMDREMSTRTAVLGEIFTATLEESLVAADGSTVIPAGATVTGRVTEVQHSGRAGQEARLGIVFTSISHGGETYPIDATLATPPPVRRVARDSNTEKAAKVAGGGAVGALVGRVLGKSTGATVAGAAVGAAVGTAVVVGAGDVDAVVSAGSTATVRLDGPVRVRRET